MKPMIFFTRVLPISFFTAVLLVNFQNCAKPTALSEGQTVASNPNTSIGGATPADIFQPSTPTPNSGGGGMEQNVPDCMKIQTTLSAPTASDKEDDTMYSVTVTLINYVKGPKGGTTASITPFHKGHLIFAHTNGYDYRYDFKISEELAVKQAEFRVPANVYKGVLASGLTGFFSGRSYENLPLAICAKQPE